MPVIDSEVYVEAPPRLAFDVACDHDRFMEYGIRELVSVRTVEPDDGTGHVVTDWVWNLRYGKIRYRDRAYHDKENLRCVIEQVQGDLKKYVTDWRFVPEGRGTRFLSRVEFELGIPMLSALLDPVATMVIRRVVNAVAEAIKRRAEAEVARGA